jgi:hypothetical protein
MNEEQLASKIADLLNEALKLDPEGFSKMILAKHEINKALADHDTIQCGVFEKKNRTMKQLISIGLVELVSKTEHYALSALGLLNGLINENWVVAAAVNEKDMIEEFVVMPIPYLPQG